MLNPKRSSSRAVRGRHVPLSYTTGPYHARGKSHLPREPLEGDTTDTANLNAQVSAPLPPLTAANSLYVHRPHCCRGLSALPAQVARPSPHLMVAVPFPFYKHSMTAALAILQAEGDSEQLQHAERVARNLWREHKLAPPLLPPPVVGSPQVTPLDPM
eukprot:6771017-Prymnesium_polylepis.1